MRQEVVNQVGTSLEYTFFLNLLLNFVLIDIYCLATIWTSAQVLPRDIWRIRTNGIRAIFEKDVQVSLYSALSDGYWLSISLWYKHNLHGNQEWRMGWSCYFAGCCRFGMISSSGLASFHDCDSFLSFHFTRFALMIEPQIIAQYFAVHLLLWYLLLFLLSHRTWC